MIASIVTQNGDTAQAFALVAIILFAVGAVVAAVARAIETTLIATGLAMLSVAILFLA